MSSISPSTISRDENTTEVFSIGDRMTPWCFLATRCTVCHSGDPVFDSNLLSRDIKPDNILLDKGGHIKLTDFGLSTGFHKQHEGSYYQQLLKGTSNKKENRNSVSLDQINLTVSNRGQINTWRKSRRVMAYSTVGTPDYIAPEIFSGQGYSFSCDWWSVGAIMFECLIGWPPFCAEDPHDTYAANAHHFYVLRSY